LEVGENFTGKNQQRIATKQSEAFQLASVRREIYENSVKPRQQLLSAIQKLKR
jgi:hypothetical protein